MSICHLLICLYPFVHCIKKLTLLLIFHSQSPSLLSWFHLKSKNFYSMDNEIDSDPHKYREEWFHFEMPKGKEFNLPNISNTLMHQWLRNSNSKEASKPNNHPSTQASAPAINDVQNCQVKNANNYPQAIISSDPPPPIDKKLNVHNVSSLQNYSSNEPIPSNVTSVNFPVKNEQAVDEVFLNSAKSHPSVRPKHSFSSIETNPGSASPDRNPSESILNPKPTPSPSGAADTKHICSSSNGESTQNGDKQFGSHLGDSLSPSSSSGLISPKNKETLATNDCPIKPITKQEVQDQVEINPSRQLNEDRKNNPCCLHKLTMKSHYSKSKDCETDQSDFEGDHKCFVCNVGFSTGNALGGHMSSHAKKRKMEVMKNGGGLSFFKSEEIEEEAQKGSENGSNQPQNKPIASTEESTASTGEKIEGSHEQSNK